MLLHEPTGEISLHRIRGQKEYFLVLFLRRSTVLDESWTSVFFLVAPHYLPCGT